MLIHHIAPHQVQDSKQCILCTCIANLVVFLNQELLWHPFSYVYKVPKSRPISWPAN